MPLVPCEIGTTFATIKDRQIYEVKNLLRDYGMRDDVYFYRLQQVRWKLVKDR